MPALRHPVCWHFDFPLYTKPSSVSHLVRRANTDAGTCLFWCCLPTSLVCPCHSLASFPSLWISVSGHSLSITPFLLWHVCLSLSYVPIGHHQTLPWHMYNTQLGTWEGPKGVIAWSHLNVGKWWKGLWEEHGICTQVSIPGVGYMNPRTWELGWKSREGKNCTAVLRVRVGKWKVVRDCGEMTENLPFCKSRWCFSYLTCWVKWFKVWDFLIWEYLHKYCFEFL